MKTTQWRLPKEPPLLLINYKFVEIAINKKRLPCVTIRHFLRPKSKE